MIDTKQWEAGWAQPSTARKWHWFEAGSNESVCGRWMVFYKEREQPDMTGERGPDDCAACWKIVDAAQ